jgi:TRAP-type C4-dicarboxylate transport system substrate-binding protein
MAQDVTLRGASMFDEDHAITKTMRESERLVGEASGDTIEFDLRLNGELGVETDYVTFLNQGIAVDYTIMAPSNIATFSSSIPLIDMPFLLRNLAHRKVVLSSDAFAPLQAELLESADIMIIDYTGAMFAISSAKNRSTILKSLLASACTSWAPQSKCRSSKRRQPPPRRLPITKSITPSRPV